MKQFLDFLVCQESSIKLENLTGALIQEMISRIKGYKISCGAIKLE